MFPKFQLVRFTGRKVTLNNDFNLNIYMRSGYSNKNEHSPNTQTFQCSSRRKEVQDGKRSDFLGGFFCVLINKTVFQSNI